MRLTFLVAITYSYLNVSFSKSTAQIFVKIIGFVTFLNQPDRRRSYVDKQTFVRVFCLLFTIWPTK